VPRTDARRLSFGHFLARQTLSSVGSPAWLFWLVYSRTVRRYGGLAGSFEGAITYAYDSDRAAAP